MWSLAMPAWGLLSNSAEETGFRSMALGQHCVVIPTETLQALGAIARVHLGDGMVRVRAGERLRHTGGQPAERWEDWGDLLEGLSAEGVNTPGEVGTSAGVDTRPARPPGVAGEKRWYFVGSGDVDKSEERRDIKLGEVDKNDWAANAVVVFREGLAMPTSTLIRVVNTAHAVLVLRSGGLSGSREYFYLHHGFVLSTDEEELLLEWGVGRALFANVWIAIAGAMLTSFAGQIWQPSIVGTLVVAAAFYRVEGALTKVFRVASVEWEMYELVPSGIHGIERALQLVLATLVALADLLENRVLLLLSVFGAALLVVLMESFGQAVVTWGFPRYGSVLLKQSRDWMLLTIGGVAWLWFVYVFAGAVCALTLGQAWRTLLFALISCAGGEVPQVGKRLVFFGVWVVAVFVGVMDWKEAILKLSPQSLQPWAWPLTRAPDSVWTGLRFLCHWFAVVGFSIAIVHATTLYFSFRISSDRTVESGKLGVWGERTRGRETKGGFSHYHTSSIPSRNRLGRE